LVALLFACTLSMPASMSDIAEYQHCQQYSHVWELGFEWSDLVVSHFEPSDHLTAYKIIGCESWGISSAKNPTSTAKGLWQFIDKTWNWVSYKLQTEGSAYDPHLSTHFAAFLKYQTPQGWGHWSESAACWKGPNDVKSTNSIH